MNNKYKILKDNFLIIIMMIMIAIPLFAQDPTVGLIYNDVNKTQDGYTLFQNRKGTNVYLIDNEGQLVNQWDTEKISSATVYLLKDGNLLRATKFPDLGENGGFQVLDWDGKVIWQYPYGSQNHDIEPGPNGNVFMITNDKIDNTTAIEAGGDPSLITGDVVSLKILEIQNNNGIGEVVWEWNAWDHIVQEYDQTKPNYGKVAEHPELIDLNYVPDLAQKWLHHNAIDYNEGLDQIMVSIRSFSEIWVIDHSQGSHGDLIYRWGNPASYQRGSVNDQSLFWQHDAQWVEDGMPGSENNNITIYNNGNKRPDGRYSSVVEITPPNVNELSSGAAYGPSELTWFYTAPTPTDMYDESYGGAQRLPNGNTLICSAHDGDFIEVTSDKEIVWRYINPVMKNDTFMMQGDEPLDNEAYRCTKYAADYPGFIGKDLTPGSPIELYPTAGIDDNNIVLQKFQLHNNFPNPFNPNTNIEFTLFEGSEVTLTIYDIAGNKVRTLIDGYNEAGLQSITWNSLYDNGNPASSGMYFYNISTDRNSQTKKMILLR